MYLIGQLILSGHAKIGLPTGWKLKNMQRNNYPNGQNAVHFRSKG